MKAAPPPPARDEDELTAQIEALRALAALEREAAAASVISAAGAFDAEELLWGGARSPAPH